MNVATVLMATASLLATAAAFAAPREKVLFDTDIGGDPDDGMALTYLLREPRCELLGVTTCCGRPEVAARVASALCRSLGRGDVPIHAGCSLPVHCGEKLTPKDPSVRKGGWFEALGDWPHDEIPDDRSAVGFLRRTIRANPGEVTLYASAGFSNLATLFTLDPEIPSLLKRLVVVGGNFDGTNYEWNAYVDAFATAALFEGGFRTPPKSLVLHGAEVTTPWNIPPDEGRAFLAQSPDFAFVRGHYAEQWFRRPINLFFHDPIAAVAIFHPEIMTYAPSAVRVDVADRAKTQRTEPKGDSTWVWQTATAVDFERFRSVFLSVLSAPAADFRPPSVPVVSCDPYFSVWSPADAPTDADTEIWHGAKQPVRVAVELDGVRYRLMGAKSPAEEDARVTDVPALRCVGCRVRPLTTVYRFTDGKAEVELSFLTPKLADELDVFSRPVTYATVRTTGAKAVRVFAEIGSELATDDDAAPMVTNRTTVAGLSAVSIGRRDQKPLSKSGDRVRCDWGYAWLVNPEAEGADVHFLLAYDDVETLQFLDRTLPAWWRRGGKAFEAMLAEAEADYARLVGRAREFDDRLEAELLRVGGGKYRDLGALAYRQSFAACKLVAADNGHPLYFSKENTSNGCIGTVDVFYPQLPLLLLASKTLTRATLEPILAYATSGRWPFKYAPHDIGVWPLANGQVYNFGPHAKGKDGKPKSDATRMPVEECGNMLIALCALAEAEGDASFAADYWPTVTDWAEYLEAFGFDPGNQLCTDDFAGHLAHNANLSIKSILAFAAYARLAERLGKGDAAAKFRRLAEDGAAKWQVAAKGGAAGGARLAFDRADSWSQKYNLVWDRVLGFGLFPKEVAERELAAYRRQARPFGVPLDSREEYTKLDWEFWSAALTGRRADLDFVTDLVWRYANETPDRHPLPDWYWANNGRVRGFWGRPVIGGVFMPVLANKK